MDGGVVLPSIKLTVTPTSVTTSKGRVCPPIDNGTTPVLWRRWEKATLKRTSATFRCILLIRLTFTGLIVSSALATPFLIPPSTKRTKVSPINDRCSTLVWPGYEDDSPGCPSRRTVSPSKGDRTRIRCLVPPTAIVLTTEPTSPVGIGVPHIGSFIASWTSTIIGSLSPPASQKTYTELAIT